MTCIYYGILNFTLPYKNMTLLTIYIIYFTLTMKITYKFFNKEYYYH